MTICNVSPTDNLWRANVKRMVPSCCCMILSWRGESNPIQSDRNTSGIEIIARTRNVWLLVDKMNPLNLSAMTFIQNALSIFIVLSIKIEMNVTSTIERQQWTKLHVKFVGLARDKIDTEKDSAIVTIRMNRAQFTICCFYQRCFVMSAKDETASGNENKTDCRKKDHKDWSQAGPLEFYFWKIQTFWPSFIRHFSERVFGAVNVIHFGTNGSSWTFDALLTARGRNWQKCTREM